jgi:hypothetical protein
MTTNILILSVGSKGPEVGNWQRFLSELGYLDSRGNALTVDEDFGEKTAWATKSFQAAAGLDFSGQVELLTRDYAERSHGFGFVPFIQAAQCKTLWPVKRAKIDLIVIHTMEAPEKPKTARNVAEWFAGKNSPQASAHFCVDASETIQTVRETDIAWHAPGVNNNGIGIEHAGYASQSVIEWDDEYSKAVLERSAQLSAVLSKRWSIPVERVSADGLKRGARGFCGHIDATLAFSAGHGHVDPGGSFPYDSYLTRVSQLLKEIS